MFERPAGVGVGQRDSESLERVPVRRADIGRHRTFPVPVVTQRGELAVLDWEVAHCCRDPSIRIQVLCFLAKGSRMKDKMR